MNDRQQTLFSFFCALLKGFAFFDLMKGLQHNENRTGQQKVATQSLQIYYISELCHFCRVPLLGDMGQKQMTDK